MRSLRCRAVSVPRRWRALSRPTATAPTARHRRDDGVEASAPAWLCEGPKEKRTPLITGSRDREVRVQGQHDGRRAAVGDGLLHRIIGKRVPITHGHITFIVRA